MNKLRVDFSRGASRLAVAGILLLVFACGAWSQTVYSSPVRVTNTEAAPVYVTPAGGKMSVQVGNTVNVTAPSASPLPVTMSGTLPVAQQGTVTVAGTVALSGTPQVTLGGTGNTVKLAGTPFSHGYDIVNLPPGDIFYSGVLVPGLDNKAIEAETLTVLCSVATGQKLTRVYFTLLPNTGNEIRFPAPMTFQGSTADFTSDFWVGAVPGKIYIPSDATLKFAFERTTATGWARCNVSLAGRKHDAFSF